MSQAMIRQFRASLGILVAVRTARGSLRGNILAPPSTAPVKAHKDPAA
jgi:hypothetical protein